MKKLLLLTLVLGLITVAADARLLVMPQGGNQGKGSSNAVESCSYPLKDSQTTQNSSYNLFALSSRKYVAWAIIPSDNYSVRSVAAMLIDNGAPTMDITAIMYSNTDAGAQSLPNAAVATSNAVVSADSGVTGTATFVRWYFNSPGATATSGTTIWMCLMGSAIDAANYVKLSVATGVDSCHYVASSDGITWANVTSLSQGDYKAYACN